MKQLCQKSHLLYIAAKVLLTSHSTDVGGISGLRQNWSHQELTVHEETKLSSPTCSSNQCHLSSAPESVHPGPYSLILILFPYT